MADSEDTKTLPPAENAHIPAPVVGAENTVAAGKSEAPVEFPAKMKRARKSDNAGDSAVKSDPVPAAKPVAAAEPAPAKEKRSPAVGKSTGLKRGAKRAARKPAPAKPLQAKPAPIKAAPIKPASGKVAPMANRKSDTQKIKTAAKTSAAAAAPRPIIAQLKEIPMDVTNSITDAVNNAQEKAKEAFTKTSAAAGEYGEFAKGNVQACVESGKILASGLQELGSKVVADSKSAFETVTADIKALGGIKSPGDFFKLQSEIMRRNFETAIAYGSQNSEAVLKLTNEAIAPLSGRVTLAVEKLKKVA
jgi:hypothetical protein